MLLDISGRVLTYLTSQPIMHLNKQELSQTSNAYKLTTALLAFGIDRGPHRNSSLSLNTRFQLAQLLFPRHKSTFATLTRDRRLWTDNVLIVKITTCWVT